ncbi:MAG: T9SS type A sorting domain-containing protein [Bacteroidetes bacterium]|nr:T9SS type A sorting domain-containing protein [Bacteroidota bacterium]
MKKILLFVFSIYISSYVFAQKNLSVRKEVTVTENGVSKKLSVTDQIRALQQKSENNIGNVQSYSGGNTNVRWSYTDPVSISDYCRVSGNGKYGITGWDLNSKRISLYNNLSPAPVWEFFSDPNVYINYVAISDTGGIIGNGSYLNFYLFDNTNNTPTFNFDLTRLADTGIASSLDLTNDGKFIVAGISREDSSTIVGFSFSSTNPVWTKRFVPTVTTGGGSIQGVRISGNDSLVIINTYAEYVVLNTFTGQQIFRGLINPGNPGNGTQSAQGISGDGKIIATINYGGFLRVYQWNGSSYVFLFGNQEPPGSFSNWYTSVDVSYDGKYIAAGTLNFLSSSTFDGKIKVFNTSTGGTPVWTYSGCGDEVSALSFSKSGNILSASSWGEFSHSTEDLYIFKTYSGGTPIFKLNTPGSLFYCSTSDDGRTVIAGGKAVHARQFGLGGLLYNIDVDTSDNSVSVNNISSEIKGFELYQNYPNPFNPFTKIVYDLKSNIQSNVKLSVFDILGNEVVTLVNEKQSAGRHEAELDGSSLASGIYFYKLTAGKFSDTKKLILLK